MARGPVPKDPSQRRRRNVPTRGEWVYLPTLDDGPILPSLPKRAKGAGRWSTRTKRMWEAWSADRATTQYGPAAIALAVELAFMFELYVRGEMRFPEIRHVMDRLGLTEKGKRDLRWRELEPTADAPAEDEDPSEGDGRPRMSAPRSQRRLRAVE